MEERWREEEGGRIWWERYRKEGEGGGGREKGGKMEGGMRDGVGDGGRKYRKDGKRE